jgi:hypothetical protein
LLLCDNRNWLLGLCRVRVIRSMAVMQHEGKLTTPPASGRPFLGAAPSGRIRFAQMGMHCCPAAALKLCLFCPIFQSKAHFRLRIKSFY